MKAGKYSIKDLFHNRYVEQIIIPEIQRDYVWGEQEVNGLLKSIQDDYNSYSTSSIKISSDEDEDISEAFKQFYKKQKHSCNIGFIYAYNDPEYSGKYFLIDGQQRLTTIYLLLLVLASKNQDFRNVFEKLYMVDSKLPIIDYKVRESSHTLLKELVSKYEDGLDVVNQSWYYNDYKNDKTVSSIINNIGVISKFVVDEKLVVPDFITYVQEYIEFWYFDTNISEQGEELYIYMNARGEQMQENENLKADLLGKIVPEGGHSKEKLKNEWGKSWEEWQNFFWLNRVKNLNADKGYNEFINCVAGLKNYLNSSNRIEYTKEEFDGNKRGKAGQVKYSDLLKNFEENGLDSIAQYVKSLQYFFNEDNIKNFKSNYNGDVLWVRRCLNVILEIFNENHTNWFANIKDTNRGTEHSRMTFIWSLLLYMCSIDKEKVSNVEIYRVLRLYYIRYNNFNRAIATIREDVNTLKQGVFELSSNIEEVQKSKYYKENLDCIYDCEKLIWEIEDHPLNLDGTDVGAINISHLLEFSENPLIEELTLIKDKFYTLFPLLAEDKVSGENYKKMISTLLFYGEFWERRSPHYYFNYRFDNWKKIIRDNGLQEKPFRAFFEDYKKAENLDILHKEKVIVFDVDKNTTSFQEQIKWYAAKLGDKMWSEGYSIAVEHYNHNDNDAVFINSKEILNTKGDFKGGDPQPLSVLLHDVVA